MKIYYANKAATTEIELSKSRILRIRTAKSSSCGGLKTNASVCELDNGFLRHVIHKDFNILCACDYVRCTDKAITSQHEGVLARIDDIKALAREFYLDKGVEL